MLTELISLSRTLVQGWLAFSLVLAVQIALVLALRKPIKVWLGAVACYRLWLLPLSWLPFYVLGPTLLAALAGLTMAAEQTGSQYQDALQQFMQFELLPFNVGATDNPELAATGHAASYGWTVLALLWLAGTAVLIAWQGRRWLEFFRQVSKDALPLSPLEREQSGTVAHFDARVPVLSFREVSSAALFGVFNPVLLLPESFCQRYDANQRHIILAHEAVHLRRGDNGWNLCAMLLMALFWTNPLVLLAWRYYRLDQELSCDALALTRCTRDQQKRYARTLLDSLDSLSSQTTQPALSAWDNLGDIKERSLMIKQHLHTATRPVATLFSLLSVAVLGASLTVAFAELVSPVVQAAEPAAQEEQGSSDQQTGRIMTQAIEFMNMDQFAEARERMGDLRLDRLSAFERSRYEQVMFNLDMQDKNYPGARAHLQAAIDSGGLNPQEESQMRYQMAQLYVQEEKYTEAAAALEAWIAAEAMPKPAAYYLLAAAYYYLEQFDDALPNAQKAVELGDPPQEGWLVMLASLYIQDEQYEAAEGVVTQLVERFPDKEPYRTQLEGLKASNAQQ